MKDKKKEKISFYKLFKKFPDEASAEKFFAEKRWGKDGKNRHCPHCGSVRTVTMDHRMPYRCKDCRKFFSVRTNSMLAESNIPLHKWLVAMYLLNTNRKGVSSMKLSRGLGITQKTAWFLAHRIRKAFEDQQDAKFISPVEVDETYMGGKYSNMHKSKKPRISGAGAQDKVPVVGIKERETGKVKAKVTERVSGVLLRGMVQESVEEGAMVYTDQNASYKGLTKKNYKYEEIYLKAYDSVRSAKEGIGGWIDFYNTRRRHQGLDRSTPDQVYYGLPRGLPKVA